jgi:hypothetical protein
MRLRYRGTRSEVGILICRRPCVLTTGRRFTLSYRPVAVMSWPYCDPTLTFAHAYVSGLRWQPGVVDELC